MHTKAWERRLDRLCFVAPVDESGPSRNALELMVQRLTPAEREDAAFLRDRLDEGGLEGLSDAELDRLEALVEKLQDEPERAVTR